MTHSAPTLAQDATTPPNPASDTLSPRKAIELALERSGMGYPAFAYYILGVSPSSVWRWMQGQAIPETVQKRILYYLTQEGK